MTNTNISKPNELSTFRFRTYLEKYDGTFLVFDYAANTVLNNEDTVGLGRLTVIDLSTNLPAVTNDGIEDITLENINLLVEGDLEKNFIYYTVRGGLPDGKYMGYVSYILKDGDGRYTYNLKSKVRFTVTNFAVTFS